MGLLLPHRVFLLRAALHVQAPTRSVDPLNIVSSSFSHPPPSPVPAPFDARHCSNRVEIRAQRTLGSASEYLRSHHAQIGPRMLDRINKRMERKTA
ncbi:unnamed protein product [Closterium sp. NIES-54]